MSIKLPNLFIEQSPEIANYSAAMAQAQALFKPVVKDEKGPYGMFASLNSMINATRPALGASGLYVMQPPMPVSDGKGKLWCVTQVSHASGEWVRCAVESLQFENPQKTMGYFSYMRRMSYGGILCLASCGDNDGKGLEPDGSVGEGTPPAPNSPDERPTLKLLRSRIANCRDPNQCVEIINQLSQLKADGKITHEEGQPIVEAALAKRRELSEPKKKAKANSDK